METSGLWKDSWRSVLLVGLIACFILQSALAYLDLPTRKLSVSGEAVAGLRLWRKYNCQACHQIYGFGGFLGPDLTNVTSRLDETQLVVVLRDGGDRMPTFRFNNAQRNSLIAFFRTLNASGRSQPVPLVRWDEEASNVRKFAWREVPWFEYR